MQFKKPLQTDAALVGIFDVKARMKLRSDYGGWDRAGFWCSGTDNICF